MFRCLDCGKEFDETLEILETHGLDTPPYEKRYVCPFCKGSGYKPFIKDEFSRREVLESAVLIMRRLNVFENKICSVFNSFATEGSELCSAIGDLYELIVLLSGDDEFRIPDEVCDKIFTIQTYEEAHSVLKVLTKNIEE